MEATVTTRIDLRTSDQAKQLIKSAAAISGVSMTDFILSVTLEKAKECIKQNASLTVNLDDFNGMMQAFEHPPKPTADLKDAIQRHAQQGASFEL